MARHKTPNLKRRKFQREPKRRFVVYCEGEKTEPAYLEAIKYLHSDALIEIETIGAAGVPYTIAASAKDRAHSLGLGNKSRKGLDSYEEMDEVWAVFDRDNHPRYEDAVALCESAGIGVGRSNPCFEVWLILHEQNFERPDDRNDVQRQLQLLRPEYEKDGSKTPDCHDLVTRVEIAEDRARTQLNNREEEGNPFGRPSTTVGDLTTAIREAAESAK